MKIAVEIVLTYKPIVQAAESAETPVLPVKSVPVANVCSHVRMASPIAEETALTPKLTDYIAETVKQSVNPARSAPPVNVFSHARTV